jgi:phosphatidate cytidylyltransferase
VTSTRLAAGIVGLAVVLPVLWWGGVLGVQLLVVITSIVCLVEYSKMAFPGDRPVALVALLAGWIVLHAVLHHPSVPSLLGAGAGLTMGAMAVATLRIGEDISGAADRAARGLLGIGWIGLLSFLPLIRHGPDGIAWIFVVLTVSWLGDTGAYFAGRAFGRHTLYAKVSPKKTWEGALGGITLATVGLFVVSEIGLPQMSALDVLILGPLLCVVGIVGDLAESMVKRSFGVKDAGRIMPGHGGLLDRLDSVLFVAPATWIWIQVSA